jgi:hypothetical protein
MTRTTPASATPMAKEVNPQFGLRIALGLVLLLAIRDVLSRIPPVSDITREIVIGVVAVGLPAVFLHFFEVRRRDRQRSVTLTEDSE